MIVKDREWGVLEVCFSIIIPLLGMRYERSGEGSCACSILR